MGGGDAKSNISTYSFMFLHIFDISLHISFTFLHIFHLFLHIFDIFLHTLRIFLHIFYTFLARKKKQGHFSHIIPSYFSHIPSYFQHIFSWGRIDFQQEISQNFSKSLKGGVWKFWFWFRGTDPKIFHKFSKFLKSRGWVGGGGVSWSWHVSCFMPR